MKKIKDTTSIPCLPSHYEVYLSSSELLYPVYLPTDAIYYAISYTDELVNPL